MKNFPEWLKKNKWKVIIPVLAVAILAAAFWYGGSAPGLQGWEVEAAPAQPEVPETPTAALSVPAAETAIKPINAEQAPEDPQQSPAEPDAETGKASETDPDAEQEETPAVEPEEAPEASPVQDETDAGDVAWSEEQGMVLDPETGKDKYQTDPVPEGMPLPVEPQEAEITDTALTCTISISCATILGHMDWLDPEKVELVPEDGWILEPVQVTFYEGESVFNVLQRVCRQNRIHMEFENTPIYNSAYIQGIHNLYEFDCGQLSGWMYSVNGWFPNYGCSRYALKNGDVIRWVYTCDLGVDVGGSGAVGA